MDGSAPDDASELLNAAGAELPDAETLHEAVEAVLAQPPRERQLLVDGQPKAARVWEMEGCWAAVADLEPDHVLYVIGRKIDFAAVVLARLSDLRAYTG